MPKGSPETALGTYKGHFFTDKSSFRVVLTLSVLERGSRFEAPSEVSLRLKPTRPGEDMPGVCVNLRLFPPSQARSSKMACINLVLAPRPDSRRAPNNWYVISESLV